MKLFFLASSKSIHSHKWIDFFVRQGHEVCWVSFSADTPPQSEGLEFHHVAMSFNPISLMRANIKLRQIISQFQPDILHIHSAGTYGLMGLLSGFSDRIVTVWGSDVLLNKDKPIIGKLVRRILKGAKLITTDAHHMEDVMRKMGVKEVPIAQINFGIDTDKFSPKKVSAKVKSRYQISDTINIVSMRNFDDIYDIPTFIQAAFKAYKTLPNVRFYLGGRGPKEGELKALISELQIDDVIQFLGFVDNNELPELLSAMDIYVSTSTSDAGIAASTAEAMACGVPAIVTDVVDNDKWVIEGQTGSLFEVGNHVQLARKIIDMIALSLSEKDALKQNARQMIIDNNDYKNEMTKMDRLLRQFQK